MAVRGADEKQGRPEASVGHALLERMRLSRPGNHESLWCSASGVGEESAGAFGLDGDDHGHPVGVGFDFFLIAAGVAERCR